MHNTRITTGGRLAALIFGCAFAMACATEDADKAGEDYNGPTFGALVSQYNSADYNAPKDLGAAVNAAESLVVGEIVGLVEGRHEPRGFGDPDVEYILYLNIVIRPDAVEKGRPDADADIHVEFGWPRGLAWDELSESLPRGTRVIVIGDHPDGLTDTNLLAVAPFGLIFERAGGDTLLPFNGDTEFHAATQARSRMTFAQTRAAAVAHAAKR